MPMSAHATVHHIIANLRPTSLMIYRADPTCGGEYEEIGCADGTVSRSSKPKQTEQGGIEYVNTPYVFTGSYRIYDPATHGGIMSGDILYGPLHERHCNYRWCVNTTVETIDRGITIYMDLIERVQ